MISAVQIERKKALKRSTGSKPTVVIPGEGNYTSPLFFSLVGTHEN
jgi:hypothetical protein